MDNIEKGTQENIYNVYQYEESYQPIVLYANETGIESMGLREVRTSIQEPPPQPQNEPSANNELPRVSRVNMGNEAAYDTVGSGGLEPVDYEYCSGESIKNMQATYDTVDNNQFRPVTPTPTIRGAQRKSAHLPSRVVHFREPREIELVRNSNSGLILILLSQFCIILLLGVLIYLSGKLFFFHQFSY
jgi:hypothetical protein